jgi:hypothetical protein
MDGRTKRAGIGFFLALSSLLFAGALFISTLPLGSCHREATQLHPGALDSFDSQTYDALLVAQGVLDQAKIEYAQGHLPPTSEPVINKAGDAYNVARDVWLEYRAIKQAGGTGNKLQDVVLKLTAALEQLNQTIQDVRQLIQKGGN